MTKTDARPGVLTHLGLRTELDTALRISGRFDIGDVQLAMLERNGHISVWTKAANQADSGAVR